MCKTNFLEIVDRHMAPMFGGEISFDEAVSRIAAEMDQIVRERIAEGEDE